MNYVKIEAFFFYFEKQKRDPYRISFLFEAEAGGFEPPVQLPVRQFSKLVVSATHPHFLFTLHFLSNAVQI